MRRLFVLLATLPLIITAIAESAPPVYEKRASREETILASLKASGLPAFDGKWMCIGPFDNTEKVGFDAVYPPEREIDFKKSYSGKGGKTVEWKEFKGFKLGAINNLAIFPGQSTDACIYLYHEFESKEALDLPVSFGSDDTLQVWFNGKQVVADDSYRPAAPDQNQATLRIRSGKNQILVKVCQGGGGWELWFMPQLPAALAAQLDKDFVVAQKKADPAKGGKASPEAAYYRIVNLPLPKDCVMEVGGLAFRPDGKLLACTRRGEVWLISNPASEDPNQITFKLFAFGLHEALGLHVDGKDVYVTQRPELTKLVAKADPDKADEFITICDKWGCSGDYHEFAFGPARDKQGNFYITLNVGFGGGNPARSPYRGWCIKVTPKGEMIPFAAGLRSPNGLNFSPDGDLFYCDNQGESVATGKMHQIKEGEWYGHPVGLRWVPESPFASKIPTKYTSGMLYDGQAAKPGGPTGLPPHVPPCIWFPYGRMGQSQSEPLWDTTGGKFGPFAGQCFVGDQTTSNIMRVVLEKVNGRFQGACIPFRSGFDCGVNRLVFGPDGASLYVGETNRGWGSRGGKPWGLQRLVWTGVVPFEIYSMFLTKDGFELTFTKPLDPATADKLAAYSVVSFTHNYWTNYGSPEVDKQAEKVEAVKVSEDKKKVQIKVPNLKVGRIYELRLEGVKSSDGEPVLHPEAYYTLNDVK